MISFIASLFFYKKAYDCNKTAENGNQLDQSGPKDSFCQL